MTQTLDQTVDRRYRALTNAEYDARHGYATADDVRKAREKYEAALDERDAAQ